MPRQNRLPFPSAPLALLRRARLLAHAALAGLFLSLLSASHAAAASLAQVAEPDEQVWPVLLPLVAAAASVERAIELGWSYIEWILLRFLNWTPSDLKNPSFVQFKVGTSLVAGFGLGILVANYSGMRLLSYLQPIAPRFLGAFPAEWDIILTGVVVGAGSKPAHDILGLLTHLKNFTGGSAMRQREEAGAALAEGVLKLSQADSPYSVEVPGYGLSRIGGGASLDSQQRLSDGDGEREQIERLERYADVIHDKLYLGS